MVSGKEHIYIQMNDHVRTPMKTVYLKDIACFVSASQKIRRQLEQMILFEFDKEKKIVISILYIHQHIYKKLGANVEIHVLGTSSCVVEFYKEKDENPAVKVLKTVSVCLITFFGAAFSIMTYDQDAGVPDVFAALYRLFQVPDSRQGILEVSYSIGIGLGVIVFFHHFEKQEERTPTAMEIQMHQYEKDVVEAYVEEAKRGGKSLEADNG